MKQYYVYTYTNPRTSTCFYVGKGTGRRHLEHWLKKSHNTGVNGMCKLLRDHNLEPIIKRYFCDDEQMAYDLEIELIKKYGRLDLGTGCLFNRTPGGDGGTEEDRKRAVVRNRTKKYVSTIDKIKVRAIELQKKNGWTKARTSQWITQMTNQQKKKFNKKNKGKWVK